MFAERYHALDAGVARTLFEQCELTDVAVDDGGAVRRHAEEYFGLGFGNVGERTEKLEMHRRNRGDDRDMRPNQASERRDFARVIHSHFQHRILGAQWATRQRQRHAPLIVVGRDRRVGFTVFGQRESQRFLGSSFADRAGDADHFAPHAPSSGGGKLPQGDEHVGHNQQWRVARKLRAFVGSHHRQSRFGRQGVGHKVMAIPAIAVDGEESVSRRNTAAIDGKAGD